MASRAVRRWMDPGPGTATPLTMSPNTIAPIRAARKAPTIPPQKRSGRKIVKCQMASPIMVQARSAISWSRPGVPSAIPPVPPGAALGGRPGLALGLPRLGRASSGGGRGHARGARPRPVGLAVRPGFAVGVQVADQLVELRLGDLLG